MVGLVKEHLISRSWGASQLVLRAAHRVLQAEVVSVITLVILIVLLVVQRPITSTHQQVQILLTGAQVKEPSTFHRWAVLQLA